MQTEKRYLLLERSVDVIIPFWNKKVLYYIVLYVLDMIGPSSSSLPLSLSSR